VRNYGFKLKAWDLELEAKHPSAFQAALFKGREKVILKFSD
jgi:hypothetical protein